MNAPDYFFGVGGAGRAVVRTLLTEDWFVEEAVENDRDIDAYFVDTDTDDGPADDERPVEATVETVAADSGVEDRDLITARHVNLVEAVDSPPSNAVLLSEARVQDIAQQEGLNAWWLEDHPDLLRHESNYTEGVFRRRALAKALYHYSRDDPVDPIGGIYHNVNSGNMGAMVVGLGGGTGAGLCIDMATELSEDLNLTLFAVLPDTTDGGDGDAEFANAYASLVELERLALTEQNPFKNIVLLPKSPATDHIDFDRSVGYSIAGFYNATQDTHHVLESYDESANQGPRKFAPFTLAAPQVLTYPGGTREEARENLLTFVDERTELLDTEAELLEDVEAFARTHYPALAEEIIDNPGGAPQRLDEAHDGRTGLYEERIRPLRDLLAADVHDRLPGDAVDTTLDRWLGIRDSVTGGGEPTTPVEREAVIERLAAQTLVPAGVGTELQQHLIEVVDRELELVGRRATLQSLSEEIPHSVVADSVRTALNYDDSGMGHGIETARDYVADLRRETADIHEEAAALVDDAASERDDRLDALETAAEPIVSELITIYHLRPEIEALLGELEDALRNFADAARRWDDPEAAEAARFAFDDTALRELEDSLRQVGVDEFDPDVVRQSVDALRVAGAASLREQGLLGVLLNAGDPEMEYQESVNRIDDRLFELPFSIDDRFEPAYVSRYVDSIRAALEHAVADAEHELIDRVVEAVTVPADAQRTPSELAAAAESIRSSFRTNLTEWDRRVVSAVDIDAEEGPFDALGIADPFSLAPLEPDGQAIDEEEVVERVRDTLAEMEERVAEREYDTVAALDDLRDDLAPVLSSRLVEPVAELEDAMGEFAGELESADDRLFDLESLFHTGRDVALAWQAFGPIEPDTLIEAPAPHADSGGHVETLLPNQPGRLDAADIADAGMWHDDAERETLIARMTARFDETVFDRIRGGSHLPVEAWTVDAGLEKFSQPDYRVPRMRQVHLSRAFQATNDRTHVRDGGAVIDDLEALADGTIDAERHNHAQVGIGGEWDFATVLFVGGVFLDNLSPVRNQYQDGYESLLGKEIEISDPTGRFDEPRTIDAAVSRHALGLDGTTDDVPLGSDGVYYARERFLDFNRDDDLAALLDHPTESWGDDVRETLLAEYYTETGFPSTRPIDHEE